MFGIKKGKFENAFRWIFEYGKALYVSSKSIVSFVKDKALATLHTKWAHGIIIGIVISLIVSVLSVLGHLKPFELFLFDSFQMTLQEDSDSVALVLVDDKDYKNHFDGQSPLSRRKLAEIIDKLIALKPSVIALDFDLTTPTENDEPLTQAFNTAIGQGIPIVVAAKSSKPDEENDTNQYEFSPGEYWKNIRGIMFGSVLVESDSDGFVRTIPMFLSGKFAKVPSFPLAIAAALNGYNQDNLRNLVDESISSDNSNIQLCSHSNKCLKSVHINHDMFFKPVFYGTRNRFVNITVDQLLKSQDLKSEILHGKAVIVGGTHDDSDRFNTPVGDIYGVELLANATSSIVDGKTLSSWNHIQAFMAEIFLGTVVALLYVVFNPIGLTIVLLLLLFPVACVMSMLVFSSFLFWFDFIPTVVGVAIHGYVSHREKSHEKAELATETRE